LNHACGPRRLKLAGGKRQGLGEKLAQRGVPGGSTALTSQGGGKENATEEGEDELVNFICGEAEVC